jgi:hypothetical protein
MKHTIRRAEIYARSEVEAILSAPRQPRDRVFLMMDNRKIQPAWETFIQKGTASNAVRGVVALRGNALKVTTYLSNARVRQACPKRKCGGFAWSMQR